MVEEVVVKEVLTKDMIAAGIELTRLLDQAQLPVSAALWFYRLESNLWRLVFASPEVETHGPREAYRKIQAILSQIPEGRLGVGLLDISVVESDVLLIALLRASVGTGDHSPGIRLTQHGVNGHIIEDAYVWRVT